MSGTDYPFGSGGMVFSLPEEQKTEALHCRIRELEDRNMELEAQVAELTKKLAYTMNRFQTIAWALNMNTEHTK